MKNFLAVLVLLLVASCKTVTQTAANTTESQVVSEQATEELTAEQPTAVKPPIVDHKTYVLYEVGSLDTVASVARKHNISPEQLIQLNNLAPPYSLRAGSVIKLPASTQSNTNHLADEENMHTVHIKPKGNSNK